MLKLLDDEEPKAPEALPAALPELKSGQMSPAPSDSSISGWANAILSTLSDRAGAPSSDKAAGVGIPQNTAPSAAPHTAPEVLYSVPAGGEPTAAPSSSVSPRQKLQEKSKKNPSATPPLHGTPGAGKKLTTTKEQRKKSVVTLFG